MDVIGVLPRPPLNHGKHSNSNKSAKALYNLWQQRQGKPVLRTSGPRLPDKNKYSLEFGMAFTELQMPIDLPACFAAGVKRYFLMSNDATNSHWLCDLMPCCASLSPSPLRKLVLQLRHWQWLLDTALPGDFGQGSNPVELSNMSWLSPQKASG